MNKSKTTKLSDELILTWIEGNLSNEESKRVENLIRSSDENFIRYSALLASYNEMQAVQFEKTPEWLIEKANNELGLVTPLRNQPSSSKVTPKIEKFIKSIKWAFNRRFASYAIVSASILFLLLVSILIGPDTEGDGLKDEPLKFFDKLAQPKFQPVVNADLDGVKVIYLEDKIIITQDTKVKRELSITSQSGKLLLSVDIRDIENVINTSSIVDQEIILIKITTFDEIIYEATVRIK